MSALRPVPLLMLAAALAACSDHTATAPAAPAAQAAPQAALAAQSSAYAIYPFTQLLYRNATAIASALPRDGRGCNASDGGHAYYQLTVTPRMLSTLRLAQATGALVTVYWKTEILYAFDGTKSVQEVSSIEMPGGNFYNESDPPPVHDDSIVPDRQWHLGGHGSELTNEELDALRAGDVITVRAYATATASVGQLCGKGVYGAMAAWRLRLAPALYIRGQRDGLDF